MSVHVIVTFCVAADKHEAFGDLMRDVAANLPRVPGCEGLRIFHGTVEKQRFTLVETWATQEQHQAYIEGLVWSGDWARLRTHLAEEPTLRYYDALFEKR
jgi:quinol monooxygenase YgiN